MIKLLRILIYPFYCFTKSNEKLRYEYGKQHNCYCSGVKITGSNIFGEVTRWEVSYDETKPNIREFKTFKEFIKGE